MHIFCFCHELAWTRSTDTTPRSLRSPGGQSPCEASDPSLELWDPCGAFFGRRGVRIHRFALPGLLQRCLVPSETFKFQVVKSCDPRRTFNQVWSCNHSDILAVKESLFLQLREWACHQCQHTSKDPRSSLVEMQQARRHRVRAHDFLLIIGHHRPSSTIHHLSFSNQRPPFRQRSFGRCWICQYDGANLTRDCTNFSSGSSSSLDMKCHVWGTGAISVWQNTWHPPSWWDYLFLKDSMAQAPSKGCESWNPVSCLDWSPSTPGAEVGSKAKYTDDGSATGRDKKLNRWICFVTNSWAAHDLWDLTAEAAHHAIRDLPAKSRHAMACCQSP